MAALPSEEQHAYMLAHEDDNLVTNIIVCCSICGAAAIVFILLRLYSQYLISSRFRLTRSDCLIILGCVCFGTLGYLATDTNSFCRFYTRLSSFRLPYRQYMGLDDILSISRTRGCFRSLVKCFSKLHLLLTLDIVVKYRRREYLLLLYGMH